MVLIQRLNQIFRMKFRSDKKEDMINKEYKYYKKKFFILTKQQKEIIDKISAQKQYQENMNPDDQKKNLPANGLKDGNSGASQQDQAYSQYQYQYYGQYPNQGAQYNQAAAYGGQYYNQQYGQYYPQYYSQQQSYQMPYGGVAPGAGNPYYQGGLYNTQNMQMKQPYGINPANKSVTTPTNANQNLNNTGVDGSKANQQPEQYDPLLDEIKRTVLNDQMKNRKSRWSQEASVPDDIYEQFEKKSERKKFDFDLLNMLTDQQKQQFNQYVRKCFDKCQNAKEQQLMTSMLSTNLTTIIFKKSLDTIKWDTYYMPLLPREKDQPPPTVPMYSYQPPAPIQTAAATTTQPSGFLSIPGLSIPGLNGSFM